MNRKGVALIICFIVIIVLEILTVSMLLRSVIEGRAARRFLDSTSAFWVAESGIQAAIYSLNHNGGTQTVSGTVGGSGSYSSAVAALDTNLYRVTSTGYVPNNTAEDRSERTVEATVKCNGHVFTYAAFGGSSVDMTGNAYTDSYDSSLGYAASQASNGDVGTNGDIVASGNAYIHGDPSTGSSGTFGENAGDSTYYSGSPSHENDLAMPLMSVPSSLVGLASSGAITADKTISPGDYKYTTINASSKSTITITGPANIYLTGSTSIDISGKAEIVVSASSTGPVKIYFDGNISLTGQGIVNNTQLPSNLLLYGTKTTSQSINISGQGDFYGAVYAPNGNLVLSGQGGTYGAFLGSQVVISGQGGVHYDEQLADVDAGIGPFSVLNWQDSQNLFVVE